MNWVLVRCPSTASKYSSNLARPRPPSVSTHSLDFGLEVLLQTHSITASKCITNLARSRRPSASPNSLDYGLKVYLQTRSITACMFTWSRPPSAYLQTHSIMASKCISNLAEPWPPAVSPNSLDYGLHKRISKLAQSRSRRASLSSLNHSLQVYLQIRSIAASKCISKVTRSLPRSITLT